MTGKLEYDAAAIAEFFRRCGDRPLYFCDTSLFDDRTDPLIWDALLGGAVNMVIVPPVRLELEPWLATHSEHDAAKAIIQQNPAIQFLSYDSLTDWEVATLTYYVQLLGMRKHVLRMQLMLFEEAEGRSPNPEELASLKRDVQRDFGPRGYLLARKGSEKPLGPTFYTDEFLVSLAAMTAITTGREVCILTKDEDVQEQFYKLQWLLDTHYRGMQLADLYADDPLSFVLHPVPERIPHIEEAFQGTNNVLIERSRQLLDDVLPPCWLPVAISCMVLGERLTHATFVAERGMERLLRIKGETGGLNTDRLRERNCHIWLAPLDMERALRDCAVICSDRRLTLQTAEVAIPFLDVQHAIITVETVPRVTEFYPELVHVRGGWRS